MNRFFISFPAAIAVLLVACAAVSAANYEREIRPLLARYCFDCHFDGKEPEGGLNLERYKTTSDTLRARSPWKAVYDKLESHQMPPPKQELQPTAADRRQILAWIAELAAQPDPMLAARDPGKPPLRRLTRLEYNNTVRDLLQLDTDIFLFPERLPLANKRYFTPATGDLGKQLDVPLREYGARYPVLLPQAGLPGDNRAEHGYRNRGDANNFSSASLEQYLALAGEIVNHPDLPRRSPVFAELLGLDPAQVVREATARAAAENTRVAKTAPTSTYAVAELAPKNNVSRRAADSPDYLNPYREEIAAAHAEGRGGVFDVPATLKNQTIAGKGGLIRVPFGEKQLTINPDADLWLVGFATAEEASEPQLLTNKAKGEKRFELTFDIRGGDEGEGIVRLAACVLARANQRGEVSLTAKYSDGRSTTSTAAIPEGPGGNTFFSFAAPPRTTIRRLLVDGTQFSGDYVLVDDIAFITNGTPQRVSPTREPPVVQTLTEPADPVQLALAAPTAQPVQPFVVRPPRERLASFLFRAFRRPPTASESQRYNALLERAIAAGKSEPAAMRLAIQAVLVSPAFLYIGPSDEPSDKSVRPLTDFELATRLAYFLWSSTPDDELLALARDSKLQDDAVLEAQVQRMLRDPKSRELSESFAVQWLRLDQLYTAKPDADLFKPFYAGPQGKTTLHGPMLVEALLLFETVQVENRSILDLLNADYTWLNASLAKLYGLESQLAGATDDRDAPAAANTTQELPTAPKSGNTWYRVPLSGGERGGYLTMGAPLTITSLPFRTSPVKRGAWLLEAIFNRPPTEPKVAFTIANDTKEQSQLASIRQRFEAHRNQAACYSCHIQLDPPGFALESFNPIGAWRNLDGQAPIDASGEWNGQPFRGPARFKQILADRPDQFIRGFTEHLLSFALTRELALYDMPAISEAQRAAADKYQLHRIITEIAKSYPFRNVRSASASLGHGKSK